MSLVHLGCGVVVLFGTWLVGVSLFSLWKPDEAVRAIGKFASTTLINYAELGIRAVVGIAFVYCSTMSGSPQLISLVGLGLFVSAVILAVIPRRWHASYAQYWADRIPTWAVYVLAPISLVAGGLLILEFGFRLYF